MHPLIQRLLLSTIVISLITLGILNVDSPYFSWLAPLVAFILFTPALKEYYDLAKAKGYKPHPSIGYLLSAAYVCGLYLLAEHPFQDMIPFITLQLSLLFLFLIFFFQGERPLLNSAVTLFGIVYLTIPLNCTLQIVYLFDPKTSQGGWWGFYLLTITYATNAFALFFGKWTGKHKMAPYISPSKTWEGAAGGLVAAIGASLLFSILSPLPLSLITGIILGTILALLAQIGDLAESLLKRDAKVKDSANIPGFGGLLDLVDSLVFTAPFLYLYLKFYVV